MSKLDKKTISIISNTASEDLAKSLSSLPWCSRVTTEFNRFPNDNIEVRILDKDIQTITVVIARCSSPTLENMWEALLFADAARRLGASEIVGVFPYLPYSRSDKIDKSGISLTAKIVAGCIEAAGFNRLFTVDLHSAQIQGFFGIPVCELNPWPELQESIGTKLPKDTIVIAPDAGAIRRARKLANSLNIPLFLFDIHQYDIVDRSVWQVSEIVAGHPVLIVDDELDTGFTLIRAVDILRRCRVATIYVCFTHTTLSRGWHKDLDDLGLGHIWTTDSQIGARLLPSELSTIVSITSAISRDLEVVYAK